MFFFPGFSCFYLSGVWFLKQFWRVLESAWEFKERKTGCIDGQIQQVSLLALCLKGS